MEIKIVLKKGAPILFNCDTKKEGLAYLGQITKASSSGLKSIVLYRNNCVEKIELEIDNIKGLEIVMGPGEAMFE